MIRRPSASAAFALAIIAASCASSEGGPEIDAAAPTQPNSVIAPPTSASIESPTTAASPTAPAPGVEVSIAGNGVGCWVAPDDEHGDSEPREVTASRLSNREWVEVDELEVVGPWGLDETWTHIEAPDASGVGDFINVVDGRTHAAVVANSDATLLVAALADGQHPEVEIRGFAVVLDDGYVAMADACTTMVGWDALLTEFADSERANKVALSRSLFGLAGSDPALREPIAAAAETE